MEATWHYIIYLTLLEFSESNAAWNSTKNITSERSKSYRNTSKTELPPSNKNTVINNNLDTLLSATMTNEEAVITPERSESTLQALYSISTSKTETSNRIYHHTTSEDEVLATIGGNGSQSRFFSSKTELNNNSYHVTTSENGVSSTIWGSTSQPRLLPSTTETSNNLDIIRNVTPHSETASSAIFTPSPSTTNVITTDFIFMAFQAEKSVPSPYTNRESLASNELISTSTTPLESIENFEKSINGANTVTTQALLRFLTQHSTSVAATNAASSSKVAGNRTSPEDIETPLKLSEKASIIVMIGFIPGVALLFLFCRYVPEWFAKMSDT